MSAKVGAYATSQWEHEKRHRDAVARKYAKIQGLQALLDEWENNPLDSDEYRDYLRELRHRLHCARTQFSAMKP